MASVPALVSRVWRAAHGPWVAAHTTQLQARSGQRAASLSLPVARGPTARSAADLAAHCAVARWESAHRGGGAQCAGCFGGSGRSGWVAPWAGAQYAGRSVGTGVVRGSLRGHGRSARVAPWAGAQCAGPLWAAALWALAHGRGRWATLGGSVASRLMCRLSLGSSAVRRAPSCAGSQCAASLRRSLHCAAPRRAWSRSTQRPSLAPVPRGRGALAVRAIGSGCSGVPRTGRFQRKGAGVGLEPATFSI